MIEGRPDRDGRLTGHRGGGDAEPHGGPAAGDGGPPDWADDNAFRNPIPVEHRIGLDAVRERLVALGCPADKVTVLANGDVSVDVTVDLSPRMCLGGARNPSDTEAQASPHGHVRGAADPQVRTLRVVDDPLHR